MSWALVDPIGKFSWESPDQFPTVKVYCVKLHLMKKTFHAEEKIGTVHNCDRLLMLKT